MGQKMAEILTAVYEEIPLSDSLSRILCVYLHIVLGKPEFPEVRHSWPRFHLEGKIRSL